MAVPCDPKILVNPIHTDKLAAFSLTSLEQRLRHDLMLPPDLGVPLTVLDAGRYDAPPVPPPMHPDDRALIEGVEEGKAAGRAGRAGGRLQGDLSWLMRTTYISNDYASAKRPAGGTPGKAGGRASEAAVHEITGREAQVEAIEATFEAAARPPVHPRNPALTPVEVLPLVPEAETCGFHYVDIVFEDDPTTDMPRLAKLPGPVRQWAAGHSLMTYKLQDEAGEKLDFVAHLIPKDLPDPEQLPQGPPQREGEPLRYEYAREYAFEVKHDEEKRTYLFHMRPRGQPVVAYTDLSSRLELKKPGPRGKAALADVAVPEEVRVRKRPRLAVDEVDNLKARIKAMGWDEAAADEVLAQWPQEVPDDDEEKDGAYGEEVEGDEEGLDGEGEQGGEPPPSTSALRRALLDEEEEEEDM